jgi:hypothetical protein
MPRFVTDGARRNRFDSDAESLPFPVGGVFGRPTQSEEHFEEVTYTLERMKQEIDRLRGSVDSALNLPLTDSWGPKAA